MASWITKKTINQTRVKELLDDNIKSNQFTNYGPNVKRLECWIYKKLKIDTSKYAVIAVCNASAGLQCIVDAINCVDNDTIGSKILEHPNTTSKVSLSYPEWVNDNLRLVGNIVRWATQTFTFPPSAQGTLKSALICDIDNEGGLDLNDTELIANMDTISGIIVTNIFGNIVNIDKYCEWATKNNKALVFDNAATPYTFYKGSNACNYGTGSVISFHHTKPLGFGEGGAIIVLKKYEAMVRRLTNFGIHNELMLPWMPDGNNYKMSEISAVYILQYLEQNFDDICKHHTKLYHMAREYAKTHNYELYPSFADLSKPIISSCICFIDSSFTKEYVEKLIDEKQIMCRKYYHPLVSKPAADAVYEKILCYPCNLSINEFDV